MPASSNWRDGVRSRVPHRRVDAAIDDVSHARRSIASSASAARRRWLTAFFSFSASSAKLQPARRIEEQRIVSESAGAALRLEDEAVDACRSRSSGSRSGSIRTSAQTKRARTAIRRHAAQLVEQRRAPFRPRQVGAADSAPSRRRAARRARRPRGRCRRPSAAASTPRARSAATSDCALSSALPSYDAGDLRSRRRTCVVRASCNGEPAKIALSSRSLPGVVRRDVRLHRMSNLQARP